MNRGIWLNIDKQGQLHREIRELSATECERQPEAGDLTLRVEFSCLNYKDALALTHHAPVVRRWPMVPGIDAAGVIEDSSLAAWPNGRRVLINGWGLGENVWGGLAQRVRAKSEWLTLLPASLTSWEAMCLGTAGYTAMLASLALREQGVTPAHGEVLVTGATGGVGSISLWILAQWGYSVIAVTGKSGQESYLTQLGAKRVLACDALSGPGKPLQREQWAGAIDALGSRTLANICAQTQRHGVVAACGLAQGSDLPATVMPFILRGVRLIGIDSVRCPPEQRQHAWDLLAELGPSTMLKNLGQTIALNECFSAAEQLIRAQVRGRFVVDVNR
jgi:acrylyl-CoA reductase (NADPH)